MAVLLLLALGVTPGLAATGDLVQKPGLAGCIWQAGSGFGCAETSGMFGQHRAIAVSPDGKNVYVLSHNTVSILDRDPATGAVTQRAGTAGCIAASTDGNGGRCVTAVPFDGGRSLTVSPDGKSVYVAAGQDNVTGGVSVYDRDPATGALAQKAGTAGCVTEDGSGGACADGKALGGAKSVAVSPDGSSVYVASPGSRALAAFARDPQTGALRQLAGVAGCISQSGTGGACVGGRALDAPYAVTISPDGESVYVASGPNSHAVAVFHRDPTTGALTQAAGTAGCIAQDGDGVSCADGRALNGAADVAVSADGDNVYVVSFNSRAVAILDRDPVTGALTQKVGASGCIWAASAGDCEQGWGLGEGIPVSVAVSADGKSVYVAVPANAGYAYQGGLAIFHRDPATGALSQDAGTAPCITPTGNGPCTEGAGLISASGVAVSPDGTSVYVAASGNPPFVALESAVAIFDRETVPGQLRLNRVGSGQGTVASSPVGIDCGPDCAEVFPPGTMVTLTAVPAAGSDFPGFLGGGCSGAAATCTVSMAQVRSLTATFVPSPKLTVTKVGAGSGAVTSQPGGIDCGADCSRSYPKGTLVTLTASPAAGSAFAGFRGGGCSGSATTCAVTMTMTRSVSATFSVGAPISSPSPLTSEGDVSAPTVSGYRLTRRVFTLGGFTPLSGQAAARRHRRGTRFLYTLSEAARVRIVIAKRAPGRRAGKRCLAPTRTLRRARSCVRLVARGAITRVSHKGKNTVAFSGRIGSRALSPGRYRATLRATDASRNASRPARAAFRIARR